MKTTAGKTKPAPTGMRVIKIQALEPAHRGVIAQFEAKSLKEALKEYWVRMWRDKGWEYKITGNTIQIFKGKNVRNYRALEVYQNN